MKFKSWEQLNKYQDKKFNKMFGKKTCPYIEKKTTIKTMIQYNDDGLEVGSVQIYEREMAQCTPNCIEFKNNKCRRQNKTFSH